MIEASSLASLNLLAANPPRYPVNPTEEPREPLTLYISRVPGTRDVILSTLKPQRKNVTLEDVTNALYYVHLDVPSDAALLPPASASPPMHNAGTAPANIARKPVPLPPVQSPPVQPPPVQSPVQPALPPRPPVEPVQSAQPQPQPVQPVQPAQPAQQAQPAQPAQPVQPAQPAQQAQPVQPAQPPTAHAPIPRKPLGPRPLNISNAHDDHAHDNTPPPLPPRPTPSPSPSPTRWSASPPPKPAPFQLTVIRRDPSTNHQWNIGKVMGNELWAHPDTDKDESPLIRIALETSGYAKFRGPADDVFCRDVAMAYGKSWTAGLRKVKDALRDVARPRGSSVTTQDAPAAAAAAAAAAASAVAAAPALGRAGDRRSFDGRLEKRDRDRDRDRDDLRPKGYTFASPWDGRCEFRTGNGGRSLKCRHILGDAATSAGGYNPLAIVQGLKDGQGLGAVAGLTGLAGQGGGRVRAGSLSSALSGAVPVSELRFNLPSGDLFGKGKGGKGSKGSSSSVDEDSVEYDDEEDDEEYLSVGLGREKAGGGNRGKRAKLGKLIVYDDGFKMLDLVVAANIGVWWVSWEKVF